MQLKKTAARLLVFAACAALASGCAVQATTGGEDQAAKTGGGQTATSGSTGTSAGSTGSSATGSGGVSGSGFSEQTVVDSGTGAGGTASDTGAQVTSLMRIHFDFDRYELKEEARMILAGNAAYLKANPAVKIRIEGHCDERGSDEYNLALGERRATAVKRYLQSLDIDTSRLSIISYGEERPLDKRSNDAAWSKNRRAEFITR